MSSTAREGYIVCAPTGIRILSVRQVRALGTQSVLERNSEKVLAYLRHNDSDACARLARGHLHAKFMAVPLLLTCGNTSMVSAKRGVVWHRSESKVRPAVYPSETKQIWPHSFAELHRLYFH